MKPIAVARRYARAFADVAGKDAPERLRKASDDLSLAGEALVRDPGFLRFFDHPSVPRTAKTKAIEAIARRARLAPVTVRFLELLTERGRMNALPWIARELAVITDARLGIVPVEATTAVPLSAAQKKRLREALETLTGGSVRLTLNVDPAVLGGARTRIGSKVYDGTLKRQLTLLHERLATAR
ncbi:MAG TPA: ATP synthase F1 subunit delta [Candidatus Polarisedimenticolia bacterium]|nr:ATP synthase F1 subunit delta [Candidatus Polarisedimenticolia bacterium]